MAPCGNRLDLLRGRRKVRLPSGHRYPIDTPPIPTTRKRQKVYPGPLTPDASTWAKGSELTPARDPEGYEGWDPLEGRGLRFHPIPSRPGRARRGYRRGDCRSRTGSGPRAERAESGGTQGPDSPCGAPGFGPSCSREWPRRRLQPCESRMRGGRPAAAQRQPSPAPALGTPA